MPFETVAPRSWSLATRLTIWNAASGFVLILLATAFLYWALVASLDREKDQFLADEVQIVRALLRSRPDDAHALEQEVEWESAARRYAPVLVRILDEGGDAVIETPGMKEALPPEVFPSPTPVNAEAAHGADIRSGDDQLFRVTAARAVWNRSRQQTCIIQAALGRYHEEGILAGYRQMVWLVLGFALIGCALVGHRIARRGMRPVWEIARTAGRIRSNNLHERIAGAGLPAELAALAGTFNAMLDRLEESFTRLARFSADIAHELRTPINNLRSETEVALGKPRSAEEYREVLFSSLEEYGRLARMVDSLLFLARAENPKTQISKEPIDVGPELAAIREFYEGAAVEGGIQLSVAVRGLVCAALNRPLLQRAVGNLVENALAHTPAGGSVTLAAEEEGGEVRIDVTDTGCGIADEHLPRVFDRFYRVDPARSSPHGGAGQVGTGLGLAIVKGIAELHGGSVAVISRLGHGTSITLRFPGVLDSAKKAATMREQPQ